jgi:FkbM family methyltransferase
MNYAILNPIRNLTRKLGINKWIADWKYKGHLEQLQKYYQANMPTTSEVSLENTCINMQVSSFSEYERIMSFKKDAHIIKVIIDELKTHSKPVFWDIGTNIGLYSILIAKNGVQKVQVVSYEPEPRCIDRIHSNAALNQLQNLTVQPYALAEKKGAFQLTVNEEFGAGNHSLINKSVSEGQQTVTVQVETADAMVSQYGVNAPSFMKIDVEGAEIKVLQGAEEILKNGTCKAVLIEVHFAVLHAAGYTNGGTAIMGVLKKYGFNHFTWVDASHLLAKKV